jgi:hypothetical protein
MKVARLKNVTMGGLDPPTQWSRGTQRAPTRAGRRGGRAMLTREGTGMKVQLAAPLWRAATARRCREARKFFLSRSRDSASIAEWSEGSFRNALRLRIAAVSRFATVED